MTQNYVKTQWSELERGARHRLVAINLPHYMINPLVDLVFKWARKNGPEWTVSRLKNLKMALIRRKAGLQCELQWVRKNSEGLPFGVFGSVIRWCNNVSSSGKSRKRFNSALQALNIASLFTNEKVTSSQFHKFMEGVNCTEPDGLSVEFMYNYQHHVMGIVPHKQVQRGGNSLLEYRGSTEKWAPCFHSNKRVRQSDDILAEMQYADGKENYIHAWEYNELYAPVVAGINGPLVRLTVNPDKHLYGGEVHFLQEPGLKLRAIASPYRIHQLALKPLGNAIYDVVQSMEWDCTFNQSKAIPWIQRSLSAGKTVHSIDLTGATDYFPLGIQLETLRCIFGDLLDIKLVDEISRLRWKSEMGDIQWKRGQPLGLYPSFGMFTLTHGLLLSFLLGKKYDNEFFVVGDDVIILDDQLYFKYMDLLHTMKCPWSPSKSLSSKFLAEFTGKVILPEQVIPSYKWRKMSNDNFLDICKNLGPQSSVLLTKAQKRVFDSVKHLVEPIGLNFSYPGSNLTSMIIETDKFLRKCEKHVMRSLVDLTRVIHRNSYGSSTPYSLDLDKVQEFKVTFDEKVNNVFKQTVFARCEALWHCVAEIPQALGLSPRLPAEDYSSKRISTLKRYEKLVGNIVT
jgi:hypothetical protein